MTRKIIRCRVCGVTLRYKDERALEVCIDCKAFFDQAAKQERSDPQYDIDQDPKRPWKDRPQNP